MPANNTLEEVQNEEPDANTDAIVELFEKEKAAKIRPKPEVSEVVPKQAKAARESLYDASIMLDYNPAVVAYVSDGKISNPRSLRRRNKSSASSIFNNSPLAPVTIVVTSPEEEPLESQQYNPFHQIRAHRNGTTISPPHSHQQTTFPPSLNVTIPDTNRLKPPTEQQINAAKLLKAQEFHEVRKFLISFMNAKGDQFPTKLRIRMMDAYAITEMDLEPKIVAKFNSEINDEGVVLDSIGSDNETTDAENLEILGMAFRSQIPVITPTREEAAAGNISPGRSNPVTTPISPKFRKRNGSLGVGVGRGIRPKHPLEIAMAKEVEDEANAPLTWLGPLITTASPSLISPPLPSPPPRPEHKLTKSSSVPNLTRLRSKAPEGIPPVPRIPSVYSSTPPLILSATSYTPSTREESKIVRRERNSTVSEGFDRRTPRQIPSEEGVKLGKGAPGRRNGLFMGFRDVVETVRGKNGKGSRGG
jgi:hypothetical protein